MNLKKYKIKDRITLGVAAAMTAAIPLRLINMVEYHTGLTDQRYGDLAAGLFVPKSIAKKPIGNIIGRIANQIVVAGTGVAITYTLSGTGRDKAWLKGAALGSLAWLALYGLTTRTGVTSQKPKKALTPLLAFADHFVLGASTAILASTLGDDSLFPDSDNPRPLVGSAPSKVVSVDNKQTRYKAVRLHQMKPRSRKGI